MLDLDSNRTGAAPRDAATVLVVRDGADGLEVFCVERNKKSRFLGGALVFPGGKLDDSDRAAEWAPLVTATRPSRAAFVPDDAALRALAIAACRETLEEAALLPLAGGAADDASLLALRDALTRDPLALRAWLAERNLRLDLSALVPFARWITPTAEARRYDTRFFLARAPEGQTGAHDEHETMASFWATPRAVLDRFDRGELQLAPPTHRSLELLCTASNVDEAIALADQASLEPICPKLVPHVEGDSQTLALVLPGDREHEIADRVVPGPSRFVLRGDRWRPEEAP